MQAVVLAAGAGQRLRPISLTRSKATVPVAGKSLIERVLDSLRAAGLHDFVVVVRELDDEVAQRCAVWAAGDRMQFAVQSERRGMAHALLCARPLLDGPIVMSACDSIVTGAYVSSLLAHHAATGSATTLALLRVADREAVRSTAVVAQTGGWITGIVEKPEPDDAPSDMGSLPLYVFEPELLALLDEVQPSPRGELEVQDAIALLIARGGRVAGLEAEQRWQVTNTADLLAINREFLALGDTMADARADCRAPVWIDPQAELGAGVTLGPEAVLEAGCRIGAGAVVRNAVVMSGAAVAPGAVVADCILGPPAGDLTAPAG